MHTVDLRLPESQTGQPAATQPIYVLFASSRSILGALIPSITRTHCRIQHHPKYQNQLLYP